MQQPYYQVFIQENITTYVHQRLVDDCSLQHY